MPSTTAFRLDRDTVLHLPTDLSLGVVPVGPTYWDHRAEQAELGDGRIVSVFGYTEPWSWWERHPVGDELAYVLAGHAVLRLEEEDGSRRLDLREGECGLIPEGAWHTAEIERPVRLLFVTPTPARTEHRPA
jgi:mannose-6-phosphate isomerase-like protein (cupin superfamily)